MKLQAGKFYKTRSGAIAYVAATRCPFPVDSYNQRHCIGWWFSDDEDAPSVQDGTWHRDGSFDQSRRECSLDLVAEYTFECKEGCGPCEVDMFTPINHEG